MIVRAGITLTPEISSTDSSESSPAAIASLRSSTVSLRDFARIHHVWVVPLRLGQQLRRDRARDTASKEDCKHPAHPSAKRPLTTDGRKPRTPQHRRRAQVLAELIERERRDDGARLARRGAHAMRRRAEARGEDLGGVDVRCRVGAKVEEELEEGEADDEARGAEAAELAREDREEERGHEEPLRLDPLAPQLLDRQHRRVVPWHEPQRGDDQVPDGDFEEPVPGGPVGAVEPDLLEDDVLVEVDAVEPGVDGRCECAVQ